MKKIAVALGIISFFTVAIGLILYFKNFNGLPSSKSEDWANFSTFNGYFLSIVSLIILSYISYITFQTTNTFNRLQIKPLLYITIDNPKQITGFFKDCWYLNNGSKNAALNIIIRFAIGSNNDYYTKWVSCTSLAENQRLELFWIQYANKIQACFSDITNERFYLFSFQDYHGNTIEIPKKEYDKHLNEARENRKKNMIHLRDLLEQYISSLGTNKMSTKDSYINDFIKEHL